MVSLIVIGLGYVAIDVFGALIVGRCILPGLKCHTCKEVKR